jgi:signal transduction histidine kinase
VLRQDAFQFLEPSFLLSCFTAVLRERFRNRFSLAIVKRIVDAHREKVAISSTLEAGTAVSIVLPTAWTTTEKAERANY